MTTWTTYPRACLNAKCEENGKNLCHVDGGAKLPQTHSIVAISLQIQSQSVHGIARMFGSSRRRSTENSVHYGRGLTT